jgi:hypothetical protein
VKLRFNDSFAWTACSGNSILQLPLMLESIWDADWYQLVPILGCPTPQVPSKRMAFLGEIFRSSSSYWICYCHSKFEGCMVSDGGNLIFLVASIAWNLKIARRALRSAASIFFPNFFLGFPGGETICYSKVSKRTYHHQSHWYRQSIACEY